MISYSSVFLNLGNSYRQSRGAKRTWLNLHPVRVRQYNSLAPTAANNRVHLAMQSGCALLLALLNLINLINDVEADYDQDQDRLMNFRGKLPAVAAQTQDQDEVTEQDKILMHEETFLEDLYLKINPKYMVKANVLKYELDELKKFLRTFSETPTMHKRGTNTLSILTKKII